MALAELAWIGGLLGMTSVVVLVWELTLILKLRQSISSGEERLRSRVVDQIRGEQVSEARFRLFVLGVESAEAAVRGLLRYSHVLTQLATRVVFDGHDPHPEGGVLEHSRAVVEEKGLFLPPEVDRAFHQAFKACVALSSAIEGAEKLAGTAERRELCRPAVQALEQEVQTFIGAVRIWKKRTWFRLTTGEEPPDSFTELTNPSFTRPKGLGADENGPPRG